MEGSSRGKARTEKTLKPIDFSKLVRWVLQQTLVSRPKSSPRSIRTDKHCQVRWSDTMEFEWSALKVYKLGS